MHFYQEIISAENQTSSETKRVEQKIDRLIIWAVNLIFIYTLLTDYFGENIINNYWLAWTSFILIYAGLFFIVKAAYHSFNSGYSQRFSPNFKFLYSLLVIWCMVIIINGISFNVKDVVYYFNNASQAGVWLIPLVALVGVRESTWHSLRTTFIVHTVIGFILAATAIITGIKNPDNFVSLFSFNALYAAGFLLLLTPIEKKSVSDLGFWSLFLYGAGAFLRGARGGVIFFLTYFFIYIRNMFSTPFRKKIIFKVIIVLIPMIIITSLAQHYFQEGFLRTNREFAYQQQTTNMFEKLYGDSRTPHIMEFWRNSNSSELIFGRGAAGEYYSSIFGYMRGNIETGYVQLMLKGGLILLFLFVGLCLPAALKALLSKNYFARVCGGVALARLIWMIPYGLPWVASDYILFWLAIGMCMRTNYDTSGEINSVLQSA